MGLMSEEKSSVVFVLRIEMIQSTYIVMVWKVDVTAHKIVQNCKSLTKYAHLCKSEHFFETINMSVLQWICIYKFRENKMELI